MSIHCKALFLSHGGGPLPLLGDVAHKNMIAVLQEIAHSIVKPSAIVVVSAHWEEREPTITTGQYPSLMYDYYGFPQAAYEIQYGCAGHPVLAQAIANQLQAEGFSVTKNAERGFDHGMFVPLKIMYPEADIPCVQLSLLNSLDPAAHLAMGRALQGVLDPSVLLIGSGFTFHNMRAFVAPPTQESQKMNRDFERWLQDVCSNKAISEAERTRCLIRWTDAPFARYCHPREEHLLPLHVCYGFAGSACSRSYSFDIFNQQASMYLWDI